MANGGLFHDDCGSMLEPQTVESEETGEEITLRYCGSCDEYVEAEIGEEWTLELGQEETDIEEVMDEDIEVAATNYDFDNCEHDMGILHQQSASRGDEDDLIMYECIECGNRERESYTRF
jgi:DNA-directed RNA polymerase subunit M/transcription elongation factor TFIIS